jgi:hypothetical protein
VNAVPSHESTDWLLRLRGGRRRCITSAQDASEPSLTKGQVAGGLRRFAGDCGKHVLSYRNLSSGSLKTSNASVARSKISVAAAFPGWRSGW